MISNRSTAKRTFKRLACAGLLAAIAAARGRAHGQQRWMDARGSRRDALAPLDQTETDRPHPARARRLLARCSRSCCSCSARSSSAPLPAVERRRGARPGGLPFDARQQHPRARLRPTPEGLQGTGRRNHGPGPLGHDHADPHRRRACGAAVDPARHGRRNPRPRPAEDQRRPRVRRTGGVDLGDQELASRPDQPRGGSQLRKLPAADRRDGRRQLHRRLHRLQARRRLRPTAASRCACPPAPITSTASRRSRSRARARTCARRTRPTSSARNTSRRCSTT